MVAITPIKCLNQLTPLTKVIIHLKVSTIIQEVPHLPFIADYLIYFVLIRVFIPDLIYTFQLSTCQHNE